LFSKDWADTLVNASVLFAVNPADPSKWLFFRVGSVVHLTAGGSSYRFSGTVIDSSDTNPFSNNDSLVIGFEYGNSTNLQNSNRIIGRATAGAGVAEELTTSQALDFLSGAAFGRIALRGASTWGTLPRSLVNNIIPLSVQLGTAGDSDPSFAGGSTGTSAGTDYTDEIQAAIDLAEANGAILYWDGNYAVSDALVLPSNMHILAKIGCGVMRVHGTLRPIFISTTRTYVDGTYPVANIHLENLTINGNSYGYSGSDHLIDSGTEYGGLNGQVWVQSLWLAGVDLVRLTNTRHYHHRTFGTFLCNCRNVIIDGSIVDPGDNGMGGVDFHDGHHHTGPMRNVTVSNCTIRSGDDAVAFNADEGGGLAASPVLGGAGCGPCINIKILNTTLDNGDRGGGEYGCKGVRFLSSDPANVIDQVEVRGVYGDTTRVAVVIDDVPGNVGAGAHSTGGYGDIKVSNVNVNLHLNAGMGGADHAGIITASAAMRSLTLERISRHESVNYNVPTILFGDTLDCPLVTIDDHKQTDNSATSGLMVECRGKIGTLKLKNVGNKRDPSYGALSHMLDLISGSPLKGISRLEIDGLDLNSYAVGVYHGSGYLGELVVNNIRMEYDGGYGLYYPDTGMALPLYGAGSDINLVNLLAPSAPGTVGSKYGAGWNGGSTAGALYSGSGAPVPHETFDGDLLTFTDVAATTAATADGANVLTWAGSMGRGRLVSEATNYPTLKTGLFGGGAHKGVRFNGSSSRLLFGPGLAILNPVTVVMLSIPRSVASGVVQYISALAPGTFAGWALGRDTDKARWVVVRTVSGSAYVVCLSSAAYLASGTPVFMAGTYNPRTGIAKLYGAATGDSTFTLLDTQTLSGGGGDFTASQGAFAADMQAGPGEFGQMDAGLTHIFPWDLTNAQLNTLLGTMKTAKGY
jgi:hypothetical protein